MKTSRRFAAAAFLVLLLLAWWQADRLESLYRQTEGPVVVDSFLGVKWDLPKEEVVELMRERGSDTFTEDPVQLPSGTTGAQIVYPEETFLDHPARFTFVFSPDERLVKGILHVEFRDEANCEELFDRIVRLHDRKYRGLYRVQEKRNPTDLPFCNALLLNRAEWFVQWKNLSTSAGITMRMGRESTEGLDVIYESSRFYEAARDGWLSISW